jgi:hypothetical protein
MAAGIGRRGQGVYNNAADIVQRAFYEVQTYNRQDVNSKAADIVEGELYCCTN